MRRGTTVFASARKTPKAVAAFHLTEGSESFRRGEIA